MHSDASEPDWGALDGLPLEEVIQRLLDNELAREPLVRGRQSHRDYRNRVAVLVDAHKDRYSGWAWRAAYCPAFGELDPRRSEMPNIPWGSNWGANRWILPPRSLRDAFARFLRELQDGTVVVEADGDRTTQYLIMTVPVGFWRAAYWILYREPPKLIALDRSSLAELSPVYFNPRLSVPLMMHDIAHAGADPISSPPTPSAPEGELAVLSESARRVRTLAGPAQSVLRRPDPRNKGAEMVKGLERALGQETIRRDMPQTALHVAMLDALQISRKEIPRGFGYDAFRKRCERWLIETGVLR
jgi:hypothetical protein